MTQTTGGFQKQEKKIKKHNKNRKPQTKGNIKNQNHNCYIIMSLLSI